jgi:hypothetical protein
MLVMVKLSPYLINQVILAPEDKLLAYENKLKLQMHVSLSCSAQMDGRILAFSPERWNLFKSSSCYPCQFAETNLSNSVYFVMTDFVI